MKKLVLLLISVIAIGCNQKNDAIQSDPEDTTLVQSDSEKNSMTQEDSVYILNDSQYVCLTFDSTLFTWEGGKIFPKESVAASLSKNELVEIEKILSTTVKNWNTTQTQYHARNREGCITCTVELTRYKRQYVAIINSKGEKEVWVNCFCEDEKDWKRNVVTVFDGGSCFFNLKINLASKTYRDFRVNSMG